MIQKPFQRVDAESNSQVGRDFEIVAQRFFASQGVSLQIGYAVDVGIGSVKKRHSFDLGCAEQIASRNNLPISNSGMGSWS